MQNNGGICSFHNMVVIVGWGQNFRFVCFKACQTQRFFKVIMISSYRYHQTVTFDMQASHCVCQRRGIKYIVNQQRKLIFLSLHIWYLSSVVGSNVSVQIVIDPLNATERPDIKFLGSERAIVPFQENLMENFQVKLQKYWHLKQPLCGNYFVLRSCAAKLI
jgi:hypothetical protein